MIFTDKEVDLVNSAILREHTNKVRCVAWNPVSGSCIPAMIASGGSDKTVRIWEVNPGTETFSCKQELLAKSDVQQIFWSSIGFMLSASTVDGDSCVWKNVWGTFEPTEVFEHPKKLPSSVYWNASDLLLVNCVTPNAISTWKISLFTGMEAPLLLTDTKDVKMIQWHPSMDMLFLFGYDNTIKVWVLDNANWDCIQTLGERDSELNHTFQALAFNASADKIVACSDDLNIMIWGADSEMMLNGGKKFIWTHLCTLSGFHDKAILSLHWSREGIICGGAADGTICLFVENVCHAVVEPKYRLLMKRENAHDGNVNSVQWCATDKKLLASASDDGTVKLWYLLIF